MTARALAESTTRCACIEVDDVRQLVKNGGAAPWDGGEGRAQHLLGVRNTAALASNFRTGGFNVTISDVIDEGLLRLYRESIPGLVVIRLSINVMAARDRAQSRRVHLTDQEFETLHRQQLLPLGADADIDVSKLSPEVQVETVRATWTKL